MEKIPLDLQSAANYGLEDFFKWDYIYWPVDSCVYDKIALKNLESLLSLTESAESFERQLLTLAFRNLFVDFNFFADNYIDVVKVREKGDIPLSSPKSIIYSSIISDKFPSLPPSLLRDKKSFTDKVKDLLRPIIRRRNINSEILKASSSTGEFFFSNGPGKLSSRYCSEQNIEPLIIPNRYFSKIPTPGFKLKSVETLSEKITELWVDNINSFAETSSNARKFLSETASFYLSWAFRDMKKTVPFSLEKAVFLSETGAGYWNRLIGWKVRNDGGKVIRFDHGGERAFFKDAWWGINEFAFLDEFVTFTASGAKEIKSNLENKEYACLEDPANITLSHIQKSPFRDLETNSVISENITKVMLVPVGFQGEFNSTPQFTTHDIPACDLQIKILDFLSETNYKVLYKQAPKAFEKDALNASDFGAENIGGYLSQCLDMADAFIFMFVGTAACEALCTDKPVILLQAPPFRPMKQQREYELYRACRVVKGSTDQNKRIIFDKKELLEQLKKGKLSDAELSARKEFRKRWLTGEG